MAVYRVYISNGDRLENKMKIWRQIFQQQQRMGFTFHNPCVILGLVRSTVILWRDFRCWHKSCSNKATLLPAWRYRYWNSMDVIMNWLTAPKRPFLKWEWVFYVYFSFLDHRQDLYQIWQWIPQRMPYKKQAVLTLCEWYFGGVRVAHRFSFLFSVFVLFVFILCLVSNVARFSGFFMFDCPFHPCLIKCFILFVLIFD